VDDARPFGERRVLSQKWLDARSVADQQKAQVGVALEGEGGAGYDHLGPSISAHGVERYRPRPCHGAFVLRELQLRAAPGTIIQAVARTSASQ
jgi:hypothetical protein